MMDEKSPEAIAIIAKLKRGKSGAKYESADESDDSGDAMAEAKRASAEDLFKAIRGRDASDEEAHMVEEALGAYMDACGG